MSNVLVIIGPVLALLSSAFVAILVYRRGMKSDEIAKQAGDATRDVSAFGGVVGGMQQIIDAVRSDNDDLRKRVLGLQATVDEIRTRLDAVEAGNVDLRAKNRELERENGVLHAENETLKSQVEVFQAKIAALEARIIELERFSGPS